MAEYLKASESVTAGHPDVICNMIAGRILDQATELSLQAGGLPRVAMEVAAKGNESGGALVLFGEVTLPPGVTVNYEEVARNTVADIGYRKKEYGFYNRLPTLMMEITQQSADINRGVSQKRTGAGDQGIMFGGAVEGEGPEYMPLPIMIAHSLTDRYTNLFKNHTVDYLRPDGKSQVVVRYSNGKPVCIEHVTLAASHDPLVDIQQVRKDLYKEIVVPVLDEYGYNIDPQTQMIINGGGPWTIFGPLADAGVTNRKIIVDSYGGAFPHGGGGFNGKDWTKVDVSGAVGARYVAKALVANGLAGKVQIDVCYALGDPDPKGVHIETFGTERYPKKVLEEKAHQALDLSVDGIINGLDMPNQKYAPLAAGGWFGRKEYSWEKVPSL